MRPTVDIDYDVLAAAKERARHERSSAGAVLSGPARKPPGNAVPRSAVRKQRAVGGFRPFDSRGLVVSNDAVNELRDAEGI